MLVKGYAAVKFKGVLKTVYGKKERSVNVLLGIVQGIGSYYGYLIQLVRVFPDLEMIDGDAIGKGEAARCHN